MRLLFGTDRLVVAGQAYAGMPLLIHEGQSVEPAQTFLWELLTRSGRTTNKETWKKYGQDLYDFFAFCQANQIRWDEETPAGWPRPVDRYRDWSNALVGLNARTINNRLRLVRRFYAWAQKQGHAVSRPAVPRSRPAVGEPTFLAHTSDGRVEADQTLLAEHKAPVRFLTSSETKACLRHLRNSTHRMMFELMARTGLRQVECRSFPIKYLFDPARRKGLQRGQMIKVALDPRDMTLKFGKARIIDVPWKLMEDLWWYAATERPQREAESRCARRELFLTEAGDAYKATTVIGWFADLSRRSGVYVRPHMLRHTYATYTLWSLMKSSFPGEPLLYIRDRLGHSSLMTTSIYLHLVNQLEAQLVLKHENELDRMFEEAPSGR